MSQGFEVVGIGVADVVLDENHELGNKAPHERLDLAVPRDEFSELTVRTAALKMDSDAPAGPPPAGASTASSRTAVLVQRHRDETGRDEWALCDHEGKQVLKWFGTEKPSDAQVLAEEERVEHFKRQAIERGELCPKCMQPYTYDDGRDAYVCECGAQPNGPVDERFAFVRGAKESERLSDLTVENAKRSSFVRGAKESETWTVTAAVEVQALLKIAHRCDEQDAYWHARGFSVTAAPSSEKVFVESTTGWRGWVTKKTLQKKPGKYKSIDPKTHEPKTHPPKVPIPGKVETTHPVDKLLQKEPPKPAEVHADDLPDPMTAAPASVHLPDYAGLTQEGSVWKDAEGRAYHFTSVTTPGFKHKTYVAQAGANLASLCLPPGLYVPYKALQTPDGGVGLLYPQNNTSDLTSDSITSLTQEQCGQMLAHAAVDWLLGKHNTSIDNMQVDEAGNVFPTGYANAFQGLLDTGKAAPSIDNLSPVFQTLLGNFMMGTSALDLQDLGPFIDHIEKIPDSTWAEQVKLAASVMPLGEQAQADIVTQALERKHNLRKTFEKIFGGVLSGKTDGATYTFKFDVPTVEPVQPPATSDPSKPGALPPPDASLPSKSLPAPSALKATGEMCPGGTKKKPILVDESGTRYIFKVNPSTARNAVQQAVGDLSGLIVPQGEFVPCAAIEYKGQKGSIQVEVDRKGDGKQLGFTPQALTPQQKRDVQREAVLDWVFSNHDGHRGNVLLLNNGRMLGVDKEQAFRYMVQEPDKERLSVDYHPNSQYGEEEPFKNTVYRAFAQGKIDLDLNDVLPYVQQVESISDDKWREAVTPYVDALAQEKGFSAAKKSKLMERILARKTNTREDFRKFFSGLLTQRTGKPTTFTFDDESAPGVKKAPEPEAIEQAPVVPSELTAPKGKPTGQCPKGHNTYKTPVPHNCPTCGAPMKAAPDMPMQPREPMSTPSLVSKLTHSPTDFTEAFATVPDKYSAPFHVTNSKLNKFVTAFAAQGNFVAADDMLPLLESLGVPNKSRYVVLQSLLKKGVMHTIGTATENGYTLAAKGTEGTTTPGELPEGFDPLKLLMGEPQPAPVPKNQAEFAKTLAVSNASDVIEQVAKAYGIKDTKKFADRIFKLFFSSENKVAAPILLGVLKNQGLVQHKQALVNSLVQKGILEIESTEPLVFRCALAKAPGEGTTEGYDAPLVSFDKTPKEGIVINGIPLKSEEPGYWEQVADVKLQEPPMLPKPGKRPASGVLVVEPDGRVWIVEPANHYGGYQNTFPKGKQETNLTAQQNALKELYEEAGLTAEITGFLGDAEGDTSVTRYYVAKRTGGAPWDAHWESANVKLVSLDEASKLLNKKRDKATLELLKQHLAAQPSDVELGEAAKTPEGEVEPVNVEPGEVQEAKEPTAVCPDGHQTYQTPPPQYCNQCGKPMTPKGIAKALGIEDKAKAIQHELSMFDVEMDPDVIVHTLQLLQEAGGGVGVSFGWPHISDMFFGGVQYKPDAQAFGDNLAALGIFTKNENGTYSLKDTALLPSKPEAEPPPAPEVPKPPATVPLADTHKAILELVDGTWSKLFAPSINAQKYINSIANNLVVSLVQLAKDGTTNTITLQDKLFPGDFNTNAATSFLEVLRDEGVFEQDGHVISLGPVGREWANKLQPPAKPDVAPPTAPQSLEQAPPPHEPEPAPAPPVEKAEPTFVHKPLEKAELVALAKENKIKALSPVFAGLEVLNASEHPLTPQEIVSSLAKKHEHTKNMLTVALEKLVAQGKVKKLLAPDGQAHYFMGDVEGVETEAAQGPKQPDAAALPIHDHLINLGVKAAVAPDIANALEALGADGKAFTNKQFVAYVMEHGDPAVGWYATYANNWIKGALAKKGIVTLQPDGTYKVNDFPETPTGQCPKGHNTYLKPAPDHCPTCGTPMAPGSEAEVSAPEPDVKAEPASEKAPDQEKDETVNQIMDLLGMPPEAPVAPKMPGLPDDVKEFLSSNGVTQVEINAVDSSLTEYGYVSPYTVNDYVLTLLQNKGVLEKVETEDGDIYRLPPKPPMAPPAAPEAPVEPPTPVAPVKPPKAPSDAAEYLSALDLPPEIKAGLEGHDEDFVFTFDGMANAHPQTLAFFLNALKNHGIDETTAEALLKVLRKRDVLQVVDPHPNSAKATYKVPLTWAAELLYGKPLVEAAMKEHVGLFTDFSGGSAELGNAVINGLAAQLPHGPVMTSSELDKLLSDSITAYMGASHDGWTARAHAKKTLMDTGSLVTTPDGTYRSTLFDLLDWKLPEQPSTVQVPELPIEPPKPLHIEESAPKPVFNEKTLSTLMGVIMNAPLGILAPVNTAAAAQKLAEELAKLSEGEHSTETVHRAIAQALGVTNKVQLSALSMALEAQGVIYEGSDLGVWHVDVKPRPLVETPTAEPEEVATIAGPPHPTITKEEQDGIIATVAARLHLNEDEKGKLLEGLAALYGHMSDNKSLLVGHFQKALGLENVPLGLLSAKKTVDYLEQEGLLVPNEDGELVPHIATPTGKCKNGHNTYKDPVPPHCPTCGTAMQPIEVPKPEGGTIGDEEADSEMFATSPVMHKVLVTEIAKASGYTQGLSRLKDAISDAMFEVPTTMPFDTGKLIAELQKYAPYLSMVQVARIIDSMIDHGVFLHDEEAGTLEYTSKGAPLVQLESPELTTEKLTAAGVPKGMQAKVMQALQLVKHYHGSAPVPATTVLDTIEDQSGFTSASVEAVGDKLIASGILTASKDAKGEELWSMNFDVHEAVENEPVQEPTPGVGLEQALQQAFAFIPSEYGHGVDVNAVVYLTKKTLAELHEEYGNSVPVDAVKSALSDAGLTSKMVGALYEAGILEPVESEGEDEYGEELPPTEVLMKLDFTPTTPPKDYAPKLQTIESALSAADYTDPEDHKLAQTALAELKSLGTNSVKPTKLWDKLDEVCSASANMTGTGLQSALITAGLISKVETADGALVYTLNYGGDVDAKPTDGTLAPEISPMLAPLVKVHGDVILAAAQSAIEKLQKLDKPFDPSFFQGLMAGKLQIDAPSTFGGEKGHDVSQAMLDTLMSYGIASVGEAGNATIAKLSKAPTAKCKNGHNTYLSPVPAKCTTCGVSMQSGTTFTEEAAPSPATEKKLDTGKIKGALTGLLGDDIAEKFADGLEKEVQAYGDTIDALNLATAVSASPDFVKMVCDTLSNAGVLQSVGEYSYKLAEPTTEGLDAAAVKSALSHLPKLMQDDTVQFLQEMLSSGVESFPVGDFMAVEGVMTGDAAKSIGIELEAAGILKMVPGTEADPLYTVVQGKAAPTGLAQKVDMAPVTTALMKTTVPKHVIDKLQGFYDALEDGKDYDIEELNKMLHELGASAIDMQKIYTRLALEGYLFDIEGTPNYKVTKPAAKPTEPEAEPVPVIVPEPSAPQMVTATPPLSPYVGAGSKQFGEKAVELLKSYPQIGAWEEKYPGLLDEVGKDFAIRNSAYTVTEKNDTIMEKLQSLGLSPDDASKFFQVMQYMGAWYPDPGDASWSHVAKFASGDEPTGTCPNGHHTYLLPKPKYCPTCGKPFVQGMEVPTIVHTPQALDSKIDHSTVLGADAKKVAKTLTKVVDVNDIITMMQLQKAMQTAGLSIYGGYGTSNPLAEMVGQLVHAGLLTKTGKGHFVFAPLDTPPKPGVPYTEKAYANGLIAPDVKPVTAMMTDVIANAQAQLETGGPKTLPSKALMLVMTSPGPLSFKQILTGVAGTSPSVVAKNKLSKMLTAAAKKGLLQKTADDLYFVGGWKAQPGLEGVKPAADTSASVASILSSIDPNMLTKYPFLSLKLEDGINDLAANAEPISQEDWLYELNTAMGVASAPDRIAITKALIAAGKVQFEDGKLSAKEPAAVYDVQDPAPIIADAIEKAHSKVYNASPIKDPHAVAVAVAKRLLQAKQHTMTRNQFKASVSTVLSQQGVQLYKGTEIAGYILNFLQDQKFLTATFDPDMGDYIVKVRGEPAPSKPVTPGQLGAAPKTGWDELKTMLASHPYLGAHVNTIIDHLSTKADGNVNLTDFAMEFDNLSVSSAMLVDFLDGKGILYNEDSQWKLKLPKAEAPLSTPEAYAALTLPTATCPIGHKTYKTPPPIYCPTCGAKMQPAAGLPEGASVYNKVLDAGGEMTYDPAPFPEKEALYDVLKHYVDEGAMGAQLLLAGIKELQEKFGESKVVKADELGHAGEVIAIAMQKDGLLLHKTFEGDLIYGPMKTHTGDTIVDFEQKAYNNGEIEPYDVSASADIDYDMLLASAGPVVLQGVNAVNLLKAVHKNGSNGLGVTQAQLQDEGTPAGHLWLLNHLVASGLVQQYTDIMGQDRYFLGGWKKKTTNLAPGGSTPKPTPSSAVISAAHVMSEGGAKPEVAAIYEKVIASLGYNTPIDTMVFVNALTDALTSAGFPGSDASPCTVALKSAGILVPNAEDFTTMFKMPGMPPCSAPKGSKVPYNLDDYNAGKIVAVPEKLDSGAALEILSAWGATPRDVGVASIASLSSGTFTVGDLASMGYGVLNHSMASNMLDDLVEAGLVQQYSYVDESGLKTTKFFVGHWEKVTDEPLSLPAQAKVPTGLCKNGHKTYVTPKPHNCPTCGVVLDSLESGLAQSLIEDGIVNESLAKSLVSAILKMAPTGKLTANELAHTLGVSDYAASSVLSALTETFNGAVLKPKHGVGVDTVYEIDPPPDLALMPAPASATVASTYVTPMGNAAKPPKVVYDAALAASGVIKPVVTEHDPDLHTSLMEKEPVQYEKAMKVIAFLSEHQKKNGKPLTAAQISALMTDDGYTGFDTTQVTIQLALAMSHAPGVISQQGVNVNTASFVHGYWTASIAAPSAKVPETVVSSVELPTSKSFEKLVSPHFDPQVTKFLGAFLLENNGKTMTMVDVGKAMIDAGMSGGQAGNALKKLQQLGFVTGTDTPNVTFHYPDAAHDPDIAGLSGIIGNVQAEWNEGASEDAKTSYDYKVWLALRELQEAGKLPNMAGVHVKLQNKLGISANHSYELAQALKDAGVLQIDDESALVTVSMPTTVDALEYVPNAADQVLPMLQAEFATEAWEHYPPGLAEKVMNAITKSAIETTIPELASDLNMSVVETKAIAIKLEELGLMHVVDDSVFFSKMLKTPTGKCPDGHNTYIVPIPAKCPTCGKSMQHVAPSSKINLEPDTAPEPASPELFSKVFSTKFNTPPPLSAALGANLFQATQAKGADGLTVEDIGKAFSDANQEINGMPMTPVQIDSVIKGMVQKGVLNEFLPGQYEFLLGPPQKSPDKPLTAADVKATRHEVADEVANLVKSLGYGATVWDSSTSKKKKKPYYYNTGTKVRVYFGSLAESPTKSFPYFIEINPDGSVDYAKGCPLSEQGKVQGHVDKGLQGFFKSKVVEVVKPKLPAVPAVAPIVPPVAPTPVKPAPLPPTPLKTTKLPAGTSLVPAEFLAAPAPSNEPLDLLASLVSGTGTLVKKPAEAPKGPKFIKLDANEAMAKHSSGWSVGGKGHAVAKALEGADETGMTFDEIIEAAKAHLSGTKLTEWNAKGADSLKKILDSGTDVIFQIPGISPPRYKLGYIESLTDAPKPKTPLSPPDTFIPQAAPPGSDHRAYFVAARLGFNLHDDAQREAWESSPYYELVQGLAVSPRVGASLALSGVSKQTLKALVDRGLLTMNEIPAWNEAKFDTATFKLAVDAMTLDKPHLLPPPGIVEFGPNGKAKDVAVSAAMQDAIKAVLGPDATESSELLLKFMSSDPGRAWAQLDLDNYVNTSSLHVLKNKKILRADGDSYFINWPLVLSATTDVSKPMCPKCKVRHRDAHLCPYAITKSTASIPASVPEPGTYSVPIADVAVTPLAATVMTTDNEEGPPLTQEQAKALLKEQGTAVKKGSKIAHLIEIAQNPMTLADINVAMTNLGFKGNANGAVKQAVDAGVIVKLTNGKFVLKGHGNKQPLPLPGEAGPIMSDAAPQPNFGANEIRRQFSPDHPIQRMAPHHVQRFAEIFSYMRDAADVDTEAIGDDTVGDTVSALSKRMSKLTRSIVLRGTNKWGHSAGKNPYVSLLCDTFEQIGLSTNVTYSGAPTMKNKPVGGKDGGGHWSEISSKSAAVLDTFGVNGGNYMTTDFPGVTIFADPDDPDAPMFMMSESELSSYSPSEAKKVNGKWYAKLHSRAELIMQEYAATQAAFLKHNVTSMGIYRGVHKHVGGFMQKEEKELGGHGAHLSVRGATGWSTSKSTATSFGEGFVLHREAMPIHQIFLHYVQKIEGHNVFGGFSSEGSGGEREIIVIGHDAVAQEPIHSGVNKFAKQGATKLFPPPLPDPEIPKGFFRFVTNPDGIFYRVTNNDVTVLVQVAAEGPALGAAVNADVFSAAPERQAGFDFSVAEAFEGAMS